MNIILQHFAGKMPLWAKQAEKSMRKYATATGADYELVLDFPMGEELGFTPQKLCMLTEKYDKYDQVCMIDMDTIATPEHESFWDRPEIGVTHSRAMTNPDERTPKAAPDLYTRGSWTFFGNWIKLNREQRKSLRQHWDQDLFAKALVDKHPGDEIILHYLINKSGILDGKKISEVCMRRDQNLSLRKTKRYDRKFCNQPEDAAHNASIIHFCAGRKVNIIPTIQRLYPEGV